MTTNADAAPPALVQVRAFEVPSGTTNSLGLTNANAAGNLIAVYVLVVDRTVGSTGTYSAGAT